MDACNKLQKWYQKVPGRYGRISLFVKGSTWEIVLGNSTTGLEVIGTNHTMLDETIDQKCLPDNIVFAPKDNSSLEEVILMTLEKAIDMDL